MGAGHHFFFVRLLLSLCGRRTKRIKVNVRSVMLISIAGIFLVFIIIVS